MHYSNLRFTFPLLLADWFYLSALMLFHVSPADFLGLSLTCDESKNNKTTVLSYAQKTTTPQEEIVDLNPD